MRPLYTGDLVEDGCLHHSWAGLRCRVSLCPGFPFGLSPPRLPRTGAELVTLLAVGLLGLGSGVMLLLSARKRRREA